MNIIAHRGNDSSNKENSLKAIINSLKKDYIDGVEFDIRLTKDKKFILNHDPFYKHHYIKNTNSKTLIKQGLDTLEDVLNMINNNKIIIIEVKEENNIKKTSKYLNRVLKKYNLNFYICSFNYNFINYFNKKYNYKCGLIIGKNINKNNIINNLTFNLLSYKYKGKIPNKETFYWTINNPKDIKNKIENIITDKPKEIYNFLTKKF
ncbi:MAG: glycerophosphodiester phosphodiesterase [Bacilli bacterium]|nr:glycerophosphodiester phosphodiesterase [Bacilli bacterium]